jgi:hypothetical protein
MYFFLCVFQISPCTHIVESKDSAFANLHRESDPLHYGEDATDTVYRKYVCNDIKCLKVVVACLYEPTCGSIKVSVAPAPQLEPYGGSL